MSPFTLLYTILIRPIQLVFEILFMIANRLLGHPGLAIIALSLAMNFLVLPLYRRADAMQEEARDMDRRLRRGVGHIKKTFSGDEKMMILQTYYRQNRYAPTDALKGSVSLLLEIPFFIAAYQFLSHLKELNGISFGPIADLAAPDALLQLGGLSVNLLPILMTLINVISSAIFLRGFPLKSKIQLYGMALFFLVFLYNSPSGLVFYWTLNNLFSLVKTIFYKIPNPRKVLRILASLTGLALMAAALVLLRGRPKLLLAFLLLGLCLQLPLLLRRMPAVKLPEADGKLFTLSGLFAALLTGLLIPSAVLASSPLDFIHPHFFHHPLRYLLMSGCLGLGSFLVWLRIFYGLAGPEGKALLGRALFALSLVMAVNYLFFGTGLGKLSTRLQYEEFWSLVFSSRQQLLNLLVTALLLAGAWWISGKKPGLARGVLLTGCLALLGMASLNALSIGRSVTQYRQQQSTAPESAVELPLSREGKNVVVFMLDRFCGAYMPYFLEEKPELKEQFDGFTWYANTISYASYTNLAAPALFGGYEYTPIAMNRRDDQPIAEKYVEATTLLPHLFHEQGYAVTVCDTPYAGYKEIPDMSVYAQYEGMQTWLLEGMFTEPEQIQAAIDSNYRNFFCFSLMKCAPLFLQPTLYDNGSYNQARNDYAGQSIEADAMAATGLTESFCAAYDALCALPEITVATDDRSGCFLMLDNETPHSPALLQLPDYTAQPRVDNRSFGWECPVVDGQSLPLDSGSTMGFYHVNMASLLRVGEWLDTLRELGVYDNTRILLAADHGGSLWGSESAPEGTPAALAMSSYYPLLMVKDFDSHGFTVDERFMTNADVPSLALQGVVENPVNPFTGKAIDSEAKADGEQYITISVDWGLHEQTGNTYTPSGWYAVRGDMRSSDSWRHLPELCVLPEELLS